MLSTIPDIHTDPDLRAQRLRAIAVETAAALCECLPGDWAPISPGLFQAAIGAGDGRRFTITATTGATNDPRIKVGAGFELDLARFTDAHWEIGISLSKRIEVIAREIERRLLPHLNAELPRVRAARAAEDAREAAFATAAARIEAALPSLRPHPEHYNTRVVDGAEGFRADFSLELDGRSGDLTLRAAPIELLVALAEALAVPGPADQRPL
jgi:hypothetical protein